MRFTVAAMQSPTLTSTFDDSMRLVSDWNKDVVNFIVKRCSAPILQSQPLWIPARYPVLKNMYYLSVQAKIRYGV